MRALDFGPQTSWSLEETSDWMTKEDAFKMDFQCWVQIESRQGWGPITHLGDSPKLTSSFLWFIVGIALRKASVLSSLTLPAPESSCFFFCSFSQSFNNCLLSTYYVPDAVLGAEDTPVNTTQHKFLPLLNLHSSVGWGRKGEQTIIHISKFRGMLGDKMLWRVG